MAKFLTHLCRVARVSISILPSLLLGILIFGGFYAGISFLSAKSPLATCGSWHEPICKNRKILSDLFVGSPLPSLTIFTAPTRPFSNSSDDLQYQALLSWLRLQPTPKIVLLGKDPSFYTVSKQLCDQVSVEPNIDYNLWGTPHVHSMFARAQQENTDISIIIDAHTFLFQDAMEALHKTHRDHVKWVLFGKPHTMDAEAFGIAFTKTGSPGLVNIKRTISGFPTTCKEIADLVISQGSFQSPVSYWAWNNHNKKKQGIDSLLYKPIPPFSYVMGTFEDWILRHFIGGEAQRVLIDASEAIISVRIAPNFSSIPTSTEEGHINGMLSNHGDHAASKVAPWKLMRCLEPDIHNLCLMKQKEETSVAINSGESGGSQKALQQLTSHDDAIKSNVRTLDTLLPLVADETKLVVMVGGTSNYKEMLLSFICQAQSLGIQNVLIAAFDEALYEFAYLQGLPVYLETTPDEYKATISSDGHCIFASDCFKRVTKLKSMAVLRVLKKGYSVLWSDMDITWFENPLPKLLAMEPNSLIIQSDEPNENFPENSILGANSGFYLARSDEKTIHAFEAIVEHAMRSELTEQPSFYIILCGEKGEKRVGERECLLEEGGLRTVFLSHQQYPNGHVYGHWDSLNATESCRTKGCVLLHNNFIAGKENKLMRFVTHGLWFYDVENHMCIQPWHPMRHTQVSPSAFQALILSALNITQPPLSSVGS